MKKIIKIKKVHEIIDGLIKKAEDEIRNERGEIARYEKIGKQNLIQVPQHAIHLLHAKIMAWEQVKKMII